MAAVANARAAYDQYVANYRQTVLTTFQSVEDQLLAPRVLQQEFEFQMQVQQNRLVADVTLIEAQGDGWDTSQL